MARVFVNDSTLTDIANAIREKNGTEKTYKPSQMADAVRAIQSGGIEVFNNADGSLYTKHMKLTNVYLKDSEISNINNKYRNCENLETVEISGQAIGANTIVTPTSVFANCKNLTSAIINNFTKYGHYWFRDCTSLKTVKLGSIGIHVLSIGSAYLFMNCKQTDLEITIYVDATTLADIPTDVTTNAPWGATNATIIYRNSTTGEVITA